MVSAPTRGFSLHWAAPTFRRTSQRFLQLRTCLRQTWHSFRHRTPFARTRKHIQQAPCKVSAHTRSFSLHWAAPTFRRTSQRFLQLRTRLRRTRHSFRHRTPFARTRKRIQQDPRKVSALTRGFSLHWAAPTFRRTSQRFLRLRTRLRRTRHSFRHRKTFARPRKRIQKAPRTVSALTQGLSLHWAAPTFRRTSQRFLRHRTRQRRARHSFRHRKPFARARKRIQQDPRTVSAPTRGFSLHWADPTFRRTSQRFLQLRTRLRRTRHSFRHRTFCKSTETHTTRPAQGLCSYAGLFAALGCSHFSPHLAAVSATSNWAKTDSEFISP